MHNLVRVERSGHCKIGKVFLHRLSKIIYPSNQLEAVGIGWGGLRLGSVAECGGLKGGAGC